MESIIELWKQQVQLSTNKVALHYEGKEYTYEQIDHMANAIAEEVIIKKSSALVGIMMSGSVDYIVSVLGILKAGRGFVPIDRNIPEKRRQHMIQDCCLDTIIVSSNEEMLADERLKYIIFEEKEKKVSIASELKTKVAYVIYTSGTTGRPKGIMIGHKSLVNLVKWFDETYDLRKNRNVIQMSNISFDVSIEEIFGCVLNGGKLYVPKESIKTHKMKIRKYMIENDINIVQVVPILLDELFANDERIESINVLICGGEALNNELKNKILLKGYHLYNHYGPTETTVDATRSICELGKGVFLGKPIKNCECYVLTENEKLLNKDATGELCISGSNLALGYLNDEELTNKKFLQINGMRIYKTGDKVRINKEGEIEYLGRIDEQVKLNGRRIELEEIDYYFSKLFRVSLCKTILLEEKAGVKIVTFFMGDDEYTYEEVMKKMQEYLPKYMIPSTIIKCNYFDRDSNGKISKNMLMEKYLEKNRQPIENVDVHKKKNMDLFLKTVLEVASKILLLEVEKLNINISMDELGVDSLKYIQMVVELEEIFDIEFEDEKLFVNSFNSLEGLSQYIKETVK